MRQLWFALVCVFCVATTAVAQEDDIKGVISSQLDAFQSDDLDRAFSFASPMIKQLFQNPDRFGLMVQRGYPMVWRPADVQFGPLRQIGSRNVQIVFFTDQGGRVFEASYEMINTPDGWQINGVTLKEAGLGA